MFLSGENGALQHGNFVDLLHWVEPGDLMIFNDTRVIPARFYAKKTTGGRVEVLVERLLDEETVLAQLRVSKPPKPGQELQLDNDRVVVVGERDGQFYRLKFTGVSALEALEEVGKIPLPPYIERSAEVFDEERYQTVYAAKHGAVAAPTAGLHFDDRLIEQLRLKGVQTAFVTLHVGAGTFQPVRVDDVLQHKMHSEIMDVSDEVCALIKATKAAGKRVIAVGTTSVRCLESAAQHGEIQAYQGETNIFIFPSYQFRVVDAMITNFHLPESTLIMLVSAFAGYKETMAAYQEAVAENYRFFSYGDAMFITRNPKPSLPTMLEKE